MCLSALNDKQDIDFTGEAGQLNYVPKTGTVYFLKK
jgi:hypothetical protein